MITLDMRTVILGNVIINLVCLIVLMNLWYQNRNKYSGLFFWVIDWALQVSGAILIALRGIVPIWATTVLSNSMIVGGTFILYFGLCRFAGKKNAPIINYLVLILFTIFIFISGYFVYAENDLIVRSYNTSIGLSLACLMGMWLMFKGVSPEIRRISRGTGIAFAVIILISLVRIIGFSLITQTSNDFLKSGLFDTVLVSLLVGAVVFLVFNLVLMVNRRLYLESKQMESKLADSEVRYRRLFETAQDAILILNGDTGKIIDANPFIKDLLGYTMKELLGKNLWEIGALKDILASKISYQQLHESGYVRYDHLPLVTKDGRQIGVEVVANAYQVDHTKVIQCNIRDITARRKAEQGLLASEDNFRTSIYNSPFGILIVDEGGKPLYANHAIMDVYGYQNIEELQATPLEKRYTPQGYIEFQLRKEMHQRGEPLPDTYEISIVRKDGSIRHLQVFHKEVIWDGKRQTQAIYLDITERKEYQEALKASEAKYRDLYQNAPVAYLSMGSDGLIKESNTAAQHLFGYSEEELIGKPRIDLYASECLAKAGMILNKVNSGLSVENEEVIYQRKDGSKVYGLLSAIPVLDDKGYAVMVRSVVRDITEQRRAQEALMASEIRYRRLFESAKDGILIIDANTGLIIDVNPFLANILGFSYNEIVGKELWEMGGFKDIVASKDRFGELLQKGYIRYEELPLKTTDGRQINVEFVSNVYEVDHANIIQCNIRDITERKQAEAKIREMEALKVISQAKSELLANVSHELRTPLTSIKGNIESLMDTDVKWSKKQQLEFLQSADQETDRLTFLIRDLLDMSRIDSGKLKLDIHTYQVSEILDSVAGVLSIITAKHILKIEKGLNLPPLQVDKVRIGQVITNLTENATKFSPEGSEIAIELKTDNGSVVFSIEDKGTGMSEEVIGHLFDRFYQAQEMVSGKTRGTGLGLTICKGIVEAHGGKIWAESQPGKGSKFSFSIPVNSG